MKVDFSELIDILRCPVTGLKLAVAPADVLQRLREEQAAGRLVYQSGKAVTMAVDAGLLREDGKMLYPVQDGIPVMVRDEGIPLDFMR